MIVDDHPIVRKGVAQMINEAESLTVVAEVGSGKEAIEQFNHHKIDVVVVDFDMPEMNGLQLAEKLHAMTPSIPVVLLTMHDNEHIFNEALNVGVGAYIIKDEALDNIITSIESVARGESYVSPSLMKYLVRRAKKSSKFNQETGGLKSLTKSELAILKRIALNESSRQMAEKIGVSYRTVTTHRTNISKKLGLSGKHPLLNFALENKSSILSISG